MFRATWTPEQGWQGALEPYQCLQLEPAAQVLNYGQSIFEGLKAQRSAKGRIVLFRPQENAARMAQGCFLRYQANDMLLQEWYCWASWVGCLVCLMSLRCCLAHTVVKRSSPCRKAVARTATDRQTILAELEAETAGADRLEMPAPPAELFLDAVTDVVRANLDYVPPDGKGSLYLRPLLLGSGPILGLGSAPSFTFLVYAAAVGSYFKVRSSPCDVVTIV